MSFALGFRRRWRLVALGTSAFGSPPAAPSGFELLLELELELELEESAGPALLPFAAAAAAFD